MVTELYAGDEAIGYVTRRSGGLEAASLAARESEVTLSLQSLREAVAARRVPSLTPARAKRWRPTLPGWWSPDHRIDPSTR